MDTNWKDKLKKKFLKSEDNMAQDNYGETYIDGDYFELETFIESLLKEQREGCAEQYESYNCLKKSERYIKDKILNAPEPGAEK